MLHHYEILDLIGAVYEIGEEVTINSVRKSVKREITLIDGLDFKVSKINIDITNWNRMYIYLSLLCSNRL